MPYLSEYIQRYFCEFDQRGNVSLEAPSIWRQMEMEYPPPDHELVYPRPWISYDKFSSIVLLGPPRSGKTTEFKFQHKNAANGFLIELREVDFDGNDLTAAWDHATCKAWESFVCSAECGELFIDSLDEGRLETEQAVKKVVRWLNGLDDSVRVRLRIHLSCREFEWNRIDQGQWKKLFPSTEVEHDDKAEIQPGFVKLALLPLDSTGISSYLHSTNVDEASFFNSLPPFLEHLIHWPQSLRMVAELYVTDGAFDCIESLYSKVIEKRIQESNERRVGKIQLPLAEKLQIARLLAALSCLSGREVIALQEVESSKEIDAGLCGNDMAALRDVAGSELFERFTERKVRFEDRNISAFLAAKWLLEALSSHAITHGKLVSLLYAEPMASEVIPSLRALAGWLAVFSSDARKALIERSPDLLLSDDFPSDLTDAAKKELWAWMKKEFGQREWFDSKSYERNAGKLVCDEVLEDVGHVLKNKKEYGRDLRIFALSILIQGQCKNWSDLILQLILDQSENTMLRSYALRALMKITPERLGEVKPLIEAPSTVDSDLDLLGNALFHLFPDHLSVEEILEQFQRTKSSNKYGMFQSFVYKVANESNADDRAIILGWLAEKLSGYLIEKKNQQGDVPDWLYTFDPALEFDDFLLPQLKCWGNSPEKYFLLEGWLHLLANANAYGLVTGHKITKIVATLESNHELRRQCCKIRIERLFKERGENFKTYDIHLHDRLYQAQVDDLEFWQQTLIEWADQPVNKLEAAWEEFKTCWFKTESQPSVLDWIEAQTEKHPSISDLWERDRVCLATEEAMKWRWEDANRRRKKAQKLAGWLDAIKTAIPDIEQGHEAWLHNIVSNVRFEKETDNIEQWLGKHVGEDAARAFSKGLHVYWASSQPPKMAVHVGNQIPWWSSVIIMAVEKWLDAGGVWDELDSELRERAIRAALWGLNDTPSWFFDAVRSESVWARKFCADVLALENNSEKELSHLLHIFSGYSEEPLVREVVISFLLSKNNLRIQMLKQLLGLLCEKADELPIDDRTLDHLWITGLSHAKAEEYDLFLLYAAAVFRFRQMYVWPELDRVYLSSDDRPERFKHWLNGIEAVHLSLRFEGRWPVWMKEESIAAMIPDMFAAFPPETDPDMDGYNNGQFHRGDMGRLRDNALAVLAENGSEFSGKTLFSLLDQPWINSFKKNWVLHNIDIWKGKHAHQSWIPIKPEDVGKVILQGNETVRSSSELFCFVCGLLQEIRDDIEKGEENIRTLLWENGKPKAEKELQKQIARDLRIAIAANKANVVSGRELEVAGNFPDVFVTCILPSGERARIFIEMKRQQYYEKRKGHEASDVLSAIRTQLADKYLADSDTAHGIYIVGWYGNDQFGAYKTKLKTLNNRRLPASPSEFEAIIQKVAGEVTSRVHGIDAIRVYVIDLSVRS